jgi:hypothetical protein
MNKIDKYINNFDTTNKAGVVKYMKDIKKQYETLLFKQNRKVDIKGKRADVRLKNYLNYSINCSWLTPTHCGTDKQNLNLKEIKVKAIRDMKFIAFQYKGTTKTLFIDIDDRETFTTFDSIQAKLMEMGLPEASYIVKSNRGWHISWTLTSTMNKSIELEKTYMRALRDKIALELGGDLQANGDLYRNPLHHEHVFTDTIHKIEEFFSYLDIENHIISLFDAKVAQTEQREVTLAEAQNVTENELTFDGKTKLINLKNVKVGARNSALLHNLRVLYFRNYSAIRNDESLKYQLAFSQNNMFEEPLTNDEVSAMISSIWNFVKAQYLGKIGKPMQPEERKEVMKYVRAKKFTYLVNTTIELHKAGKIDLVNWLQSGVLLKKTLERLTGVTLKTIKKYYNMLLEVLTIMFGNQDAIIEASLVFSGNYNTFSDIAWNKYKNSNRFIIDYKKAVDNLNIGNWALPFITLEAENSRFYGFTDEQVCAIIDSEIEAKAA